MRKALTRSLVASVLLLVIGGCNSCQQSPELPAPVAKEGRLPRAPEPATSPPPSQVPNPSCAVIASSSVEEGPAPLEVQFSAEGMCTDADGTYTWDFGDGSEVVHKSNTAHTYEKPGTYTARVTLADPAHDATDSDEAPITVTAP